MPEQLDLFDQPESPSPSSPETSNSEPETETHTVWVGFDRELTDQAADWLRRFGFDKQADQVSVSWNKRMRSSAGRAKYQSAEIELNPRLQILPEEQRAEEINRTFLHELAHLLAFFRNPRRKIQAHGVEWQQACADLGIPGESRCHDLEFPVRRQKKKFAYSCPSCGESIQRVRRIRRPVACHPCCKKHNRGRFHKKYQLREETLS